MKTAQEILNLDGLLDIETGLDGGRCCIKFPNFIATIVWSFGAGWEHVSMSPLQRNVMPSWDDMRKLKDMFFNKDEAVIQIHPAEDVYVNMLDNCLHLWRCTYREMVLPPTCLVGLRKGQTMEELNKEFADYCNYVKNFKGAD